MARFNDKIDDLADEATKSADKVARTVRKATDKVARTVRKAIEAGDDQAKRAGRRVKRAVRKLDARVD